MFFNNKINNVIDIKTNGVQKGAGFFGWQKKLKMKI